MLWGWVIRPNWTLFANRRTEYIRVKAPKAAGLNPRARKTMVTKFPPEMSIWSPSAHGVFLSAPSWPHLFSAGLEGTAMEADIALSLHLSPPGTARILVTLQPTSD